MLNKYTTVIIDGRIDLIMDTFSEAVEALDPFQQHADRTADMREEYSPAYNYSDSIVRGLLATEEWCEREADDYAAAVDAWRGGERARWGCD